MAPIDENDLKRVEHDQQMMSKTLTEIVVRLATIDTTLAVMKTEAHNRDEKLQSIQSLGRTVLITVITVSVGAVLAFFFNRAGLG